MAKKTTPIEDRIPADVLAAIDEAAVEIAADTNLTKAEARDRILGRLSAAADAADVEEVAEEIEDEEDKKPAKGKGKGKGKEKGKEKDEENEDEDEDEDEDEEDEEDEKDEKPPPTHWSGRPLFGGKK